MNDLLYFADAVAPGSFNDILFGNNVTSFHLGGPISNFDTKTGVFTDVTLTGWAITPVPATTSRAAWARPTAPCWRAR